MGQGLARVTQLAGDRAAVAPLSYLPVPGSLSFGRKGALLTGWNLVHKVVKGSRL